MNTAVSAYTHSCKLRPIACDPATAAGTLNLAAAAWASPANSLFNVYPLIDAKSVHE